MSKGPTSRSSGLWHSASVPHATWPNARTHHTLTISLFHSFTLPHFNTFKLLAGFCICFFQLCHKTNIRDASGKSRMVMVDDDMKLIDLGGSWKSWLVPTFKKQSIIFTFISFSCNHQSPTITFFINLPGHVSDILISINTSLSSSSSKVSSL